MLSISIHERNFVNKFIEIAWVDASGWLLSIVLPVTNIDHRLPAAIITDCKWNAEIDAAILMLKLMVFRIKIVWRFQ